MTYKQLPLVSHTSAECWQCDYIIRKDILNALEQMTCGLSRRVVLKQSLIVRTLSDQTGAFLQKITESRALVLYQIRYSTPSTLNIILTVSFPRFVITRLHSSTVVVLA